MKLYFTHIGLCVFLFSFIIAESGADLPCAARPVYNRSVVCVCGRGYCDEITRTPPNRGSFVTYTTSEDGARFKKRFGRLQPTDYSYGMVGEMLSLDLNPEKRYQKIHGFGGAVTDSVGIIYRSLPADLKKYIIDSYFSERGLEYNLMRVPIGSSDFSVRNYSLDDYRGDIFLTNFSLQYEDFVYKVPLLRDIIKASKAQVHVIGTSWSPPRWMKKTTDENPVCGFLKHEYYQTFADYLYRFVESYEAEGVPIWALTTSNEPTLATFPATISSCLGWATRDLGNWIVNNLGPTIRRSKHKDLKILALDDQRHTIPIIFAMMVTVNPAVLDYIDGIAVHYYFDSFVSPEVLKNAYETYSKFIISTEASAGSTRQDIPVDLGSWSRAERYALDIIEDLNNNVGGWVDWNIWLNPQGGPNVDANFVDSPIIVDVTNQEFIKQPMFYALGHFTKFLPRDSQRIEVGVPPCSCAMPHVAFLTPSNTIVVVIYNNGTSKGVVLRLRGREAVIYLKSNSITTVELVNE